MVESSLDLDVVVDPYGFTHSTTGSRSPTCSPAGSNRVMRAHVSPGQVTISTRYARVGIRSASGAFSSTTPSPPASAPPATHPSASLLTRLSCCSAISQPRASSASASAAAASLRIGAKGGNGECSNCPDGPNCPDCPECPGGPGGPGRPNCPYCPDCPVYPDCPDCARYSRFILAKPVRVPHLCMGATSTDVAAPTARSAAARGATSGE